MDLVEDEDQIKHTIRISKFYNIPLPPSSIPSFFPPSIHSLADIVAKTWADTGSSPPFTTTTSKRQWYESVSTPYCVETRGGSKTWSIPWEKVVEHGR